jgi:hypothetical protein
MVVIVDSLLQILPDPQLPLTHHEITDADARAYNSV